MNSPRDKHKLKTFSSQLKNADKFKLFNKSNLSKNVGKIDLLAEEIHQLSRGRYDYSKMNMKNNSKNKKKNLKLKISAENNKKNELPKIEENNKLILSLKEIGDKKEEAVEEEKEYKTEENFGRKFAWNDPHFEVYDETNKEQYYQRNGLVDFKIKKKNQIIKKKILKKNLDYYSLGGKAEFRLITNAHEKLMQKKWEQNIDFKLKNYGEEKSKEVYYVDLYNKMIGKKEKDIFILLKKEEFSSILIEDFIKTNYPDYNKCSVKNQRKLFVIKNSTVVTNPKNISGLIVQIPTQNLLSKFSIEKRKTIVKNFLFFCTEKFKSQIKFNYIYLNNGTIINDFIDIKENNKFIFISSTTLFEGLSISLNKNMINLYNKYFLCDDKNNGAFADSSDDDYIKEKDGNINDNDYDNIYDIFFKKRTKLNFEKLKKVTKKQFDNKTNRSFTDGISLEKEEYIYLSESEDKKEEAYKKILQCCKNGKHTKMDFFIKIQNEIYDEKIKKKIKCLSKYQKPKPMPSLPQMVSKYLKHIGLREKEFSKREQATSKKFGANEIIESFKILKQNDPSLDLRKFILWRDSDKMKQDLPFVTKNITQSENKYFKNDRKTETFFPTLLSYNVPKTLEEHPKYTRNELITHFTKFKSLVNLWFNMHNNTKLAQYGIDLDTFHKCNKELCSEQIELVKEIFNEVNNGITGMLNVEDYVDALTMLRRQNLKDQMDFFLRVFDKRGKGEFTFDEVYTICKISIKRLIQNNNNISKDCEIIGEIADFFANFLYQIVGVKTSEGLPVAKLKHIIENDEKDIEYIEVFCCSYKNKKKK